MKWQLSILVLLICLCVTDAMSADRVRRAGGKETVFGDITSISDKEVVVTDRGVKTTIPVEEIRSIVYEGEPKELTSARAYATQGRLEDALKELSKIDRSKIRRKMIVDDIEFLKAYAAARLALQGRGDIRTAGSQMIKFISGHRNNYHWFDANRLVGELLLANRQYAKAEQSFDSLTKAPSIEWQLEGEVGKGRSQLAQGKMTEAMATFRRALDLKPTGINKLSPEMVEKRQLAEIGLARCLIAEDKTDEAVKRLQGILEQINPENATIAGEAYNALGTAQRKAGKPQDAILAFLHVDILYFTNAQAHAEALSNLAELWQEIHRTDRAIKAQEVLKTRYPNSAWTPH